MMVLAFCLFGLIVGVTAILALGANILLRKKHFSDVTRLAKFNFRGTFCELSIIGSFGPLSLWAGFSNESNWYLSILGTTILFLIIFIGNQQALLQHALQEATESVAD